MFRKIVIMSQFKIRKLRFWITCIKFKYKINTKNEKSNKEYVFVFFYIFFIETKKPGENKR
jgi:hypothetical protein